MRIFVVQGCLQSMNIDSQGQLDQHLQCMLQFMEGSCDIGVWRDMLRIISSCGDTDLLTLLCRHIPNSISSNNKWIDVIYSITRRHGVTSSTGLKRSLAGDVCLANRNQIDESVQPPSDPVQHRDKRFKLLTN